MFPQQIFQMLYSWTQIDFLQTMANFLGRGAGLLFDLRQSYPNLQLFWVSIMLTVQIADDLKKNGGYIPGIVPENPLQSTLITS